MHSCVHCLCMLVFLFSFLVLIRQGGQYNVYEFLYRVIDDEDGLCDVVRLTLNFLLDIKCDPHLCNNSQEKKKAYFSFTIQIFAMPLSMEDARRTSSNFSKKVIKQNFLNCF